MGRRRSTEWQRAKRVLLDLVPLLLPPFPTTKVCCGKRSLLLACAGFIEFYNVCVMLRRRCCTGVALRTSHQSLWSIP